MTQETIDKLCCPFDHADLKLTIISNDIQENIVEGTLVCSSCSRIYPIVSGIPIMSPDEYREFKLEKPLLERLTKEKISDNFRLISEGEHPL